MPMVWYNIEQKQREDHSKKIVDFKTNQVVLERERFEKGNRP
jgi:hypothetical protein